MNEFPPAPLGPPANKPISVKLARALAEAVDGLPNRGNPVFVVACYEPVNKDFGGGFMMWGPFHSWEEVKDEPLQCINEGKCGFFGPFIVPIKPARGLPVTGVDLEIDGWTAPFTFPIRPDAVFFNVAGVEKFAAPYYERLFGPNFAEQVMTQFRNADVQVMAHYPWSEYTDGTETLGRVAEVPVFLIQDPSGGTTYALRPEAGTAILRPVRKT